MSNNVLVFFSYFFLIKLNPNIINTVMPIIFFLISCLLKLYITVQYKITEKKKKIDQSSWTCKMSFQNNAVPKQTPKFYSGFCGVSSFPPAIVSLSLLHNTFVLIFTREKKNLIHYVSALIYVFACVHF